MTCLLILYEAAYPPCISAKFQNCRIIWKKKFSPVGEEDILKSLLSLNVSKATGLDGLSARFLKNGANKISSAIAHIINLSLYSGCLPDDMKTARVVPLYEKNSKSEPGNYRPVSILTVMSKILEKTEHKQLENYLRSAKLLYDYQSGFMNSYSTDSCLTQLTDQIRFDMDKGNHTGMVMIDLQKAFDTVDLDILLNKVKAIGLIIFKK